jgi:ATP-binding cassette subfamily B multidrug efflux pump
MQEFLETSVLSVGDITLLFGIVGVMLYLDPKLGLLTLSVLPILFIVRLFWLPLARKSFMAAHETNSVANGALAEAIHGVRAVQSMDRQGVNFTLYDDKAKANLLTHLTAARYAQVMVPIVDSLTGVAMALVIVVGGARVSEPGARCRRARRLPVLHPALLRPDPFADPAIFGDAARHGIRPAPDRSARRAGRYPGCAGCHRACRRTWTARSSSVTSCSATARSIPVLKHVSFKVNPGETVALVGPTGSGKSSCMSLIHRFYDVQQGQVLVGGHDVRALTQDSLGDQIAMVLQEPFLFTGTVFENIRYHKRKRRAKR